MRPRGATLSSPASVVLIARVESLSLAATLSPAAVRSAGAGLSAGSIPVSVTTKWAVPANYTTFRVVGYMEGEGPFAAAPPAEKGESPALGNDAAAPGETLLVVDSGQTNAAHTRTDQVVLPAEEEGQEERGSGADEGRLTLLVQAL